MTILLKTNQNQLIKALKHLNYSYLKIKKMGLEINEQDEEQLETWESFSSRFSRVVDLFLSKYLRTYVLYHDPGFSGSLRDHINFAEKQGLIEDAQWWLGLRELRNISAHEYNEKDLIQFYHRIYKECERLLGIEKSLDQHTSCD
jgi:hypothetical protein